MKPTKKCPRCKQILARTDFYELPSRTSSMCRPCANSYSKEWKNRDITAHRKKNMARVLRYRYGIEEKDYEKLWLSQGGRCAICEELSLDGKRLHVDHSHSDNKIRGLLCGNCNRMLGLAMDSIQTLYRAADYLERGTRMPPRPKTAYQLSGKKA